MKNFSRNQSGGHAYKQQSPKRHLTKFFVCLLGIVGAVYGNYKGPLHINE